MTERSLPAERGVDAARPELGGGAASPSFHLPDGAPGGIPGGLGETRIGRRTFRWGLATHVMGIVNVTPDSFSGDGLLADGRAVAGEARGAVDAAAEAAVELARSMAD